MIGMLDDQAGMSEIYTKSELMRRIKQVLDSPTHLHSSFMPGLEGVSTHQSHMDYSKVVCYYGVPTLRIHADKTIAMIE